MDTTLELTAPQVSEEKLDVIEKILANALAHAQGHGKAGVLLHGDPGVGKTSFVRQLSKLLGMELVVIEVPHITEEHIINIPFIVYDPVTDKTNKTEMGFDPNSFEVVLSSSALLSQLTKAKKIPDAAYLKALYEEGGALVQVFEELGGSKDTVPLVIKRVRDSKQVILFLDEYFRQTSNRIKNMLRGILNSKIGLDDLPRNVFVIYASNMNDEGVDEMPLNADFRALEFNVPDKGDWFAWLVNKFKKSDVKLNQAVVQKFYDLLKQEHLSHSDIAADVRISPRRWEQVLLYISAALPVDDEKEAAALLSNVKLQFKNYLTGDHAELYREVMDAVVELIDETSDIKVTADSHLGNENWREVLKHQLKMKQKLGKHRSYIPVVSGLPGIGKTTEMLTAATELNMRYIPIDCSTLDPEDVIGIPLAEKDGKKINTRFSSPKLFTQITNDIAEADKDYLEHLKNSLSAADYKTAVKHYEAQPYKYLVFFDELNRTSTKVFNGLRRVLLEKSFSDKERLPDGTIVVAAINPSDVGAGRLTSHMQDVVDIIDSEPNWSNTVKFLENMQLEATDSSKKTVMDVIKGVVSVFKTNKRNGEFWLNVGENPAYISPREYADLYANSVLDFDMKVARLQKKMNSDDPATAEEAIGRLKHGLFTSIKSTMQNVLKKQGLDNPGFYSDLEDWINRNLEIGEGIIFKKGKVGASLSDIADRHWGKETGSIAEDPDIVNYLLNTSIQTFKEEMEQYLREKLNNADNIRAALSKSHKTTKSMKGGKPTTEAAETSPLQNFLRDLIISLHLHEIPGDKHEAFKKALMGVLHDDDFLASIKKIVPDPEGSEYHEQLLSSGLAAIKLARTIAKGP